MNHKAQSLSIFFTVLIVGLPLATWGLSLLLSKSKDLTLSNFFKSSWSKFVALVSKKPTLFALSLILMIITPPLVMQPKGSFLSMLGTLTSAFAYISMLACQIITYKSNSPLFEPQGELASRNNFVMGYHLFVLQLFLFFASLLGLLFFVVPAIIFKIYTFMASPISVCECKSLGAMWRSFKLCKAHFWDVAKISLPFLICINTPLVILPALRHAIEEPVVLTMALTAVRIFEFFANTLSWQCQSMLYDYLKRPGEAENQS